MSKQILYLFFVILVLTTFFSFSFVHAQTNNSTKNLEKLELTFPVNFTEKEKKFINTLPSTDLEKLIKVIKLIVEKNKQASQQNSKIEQFFSGQNQPTTYSNNPSPQTPYFNPSTGQYQSSPSSPSSPSSGPINNSSSPQQGPVGPQQQTPLQSMLQPLAQQLQQPPLTRTTFDPLANGELELPSKTSGSQIPSVDPGNVSEICKQNSGVNFQPGGRTSGKCPGSIQNLDQRVKNALMEACTKIGRPISIASGFRDPNCNRKSGGAPKSAHISGLALDINVYQLGDHNTQVAVFEVFKKHGFGSGGWNCYSPGVIHIDLASPRNWGGTSCARSFVQVFRKGTIGG